MSDLGDRWYSVDEMCNHLGVCSDTIYNWIEKRGMPAHKIGRRWKFKKNEVDEWARAGHAAGTSMQEKRGLR